MKEDYLWDKTGTDTEIERLENALLTFRFQQTEPLALPAKIVPFEAKSPRGFFRLSFAFASFAALLIVGFGIWFQFSGRNSDVAKSSPQTISALTVENSAKGILSEKPENLIVAKVETPKQSAEQKIVKIKKISAQTIRQNNLTARNIETDKQHDSTALNIAAKKPTTKFTKQEIYAYDQLMLALSITSSKLKLVQDKVDGVEDKTNISENER